MAEFYVFPSADQRDVSQAVARSFAPRDPSVKAIPTSRDWAKDTLRLHAGITLANTVLCQSKAELMKTLADGDAGGLLETLMATLEHAAEGFEQFKAFCLAAEARILVADEALMQEWPADA